MCRVIIVMVFMGLSLCKGADFDTRYYLDVYEKYSLAPQDLTQMKHAWVVEQLKKIAEKNQAIQIQTVGSSAEQRSLYRISFGIGPTRILLWSQMHGDECTATAALLAVFNYLALQGQDPQVRNIYQNLSIHAILMLNPDGAENNQRWNAQDIDINRDARVLTTPEARVLKQMQELIKPDYGFNLHDMMGREMVDENKKALYLAFMAPPFNKEDEDTATRVRAKKLIVYLKNSLDPFIGGHIARYKADYMPRAFGDAMQSWGVSTVLIEAGLNDTNDPHYLVKLNFAALLSAFQVIATGKIDQEDPALYDQIPLEGISLFDLVIHDVMIYNGTTISPFRADIGINIETKTVDQKEIKEGVIEEIGDLSLTTGIKVIEGENLVAIPGLIVKRKQVEDPSNLLPLGITTAVIASAEGKSGADEYFYFAQNIPGDLINDLPENKLIRIDQIPAYTSVPAAALNLKKSGLIKRGKQADLLIFHGLNNGQLDLSQLIYVIKNGVVVKVR